MPSLHSSTVAVCRIQGTVRAAVRAAMEAANWRAHVPEGSSIAVKPNLCWDLPLPGAQTSPWVLDAVLEVLSSVTDDLIVVEAGQVTVDADRALERCGLGGVLARRGVPFVNMSHGAFVSAHLADASVLHRVELPQAISGRRLVTVPVLKTHAMTTVTGALKNQWGCLRELRHNHHLVVDEAISDINALVKPAFAVMDGTVGLEGNGPKTGRPRVADLVIASADPVALDATAARIMGFAVEEIDHIRIANSRGLGVLHATDIDVRGDVRSLPRLDFAPARPGIVGRTEFALRRSPLRALAFETRAMGALAFAAKAYNAAWYHSVGTRYRRHILDSSRYGAQWLGVWEHEDEAREGDDPLGVDGERSS